MKGRQSNSATIAVTRNEILIAFNQGDSAIQQNSATPFQIPALPMLV